jgi:hypothetical protein
MMNFFKTKGAIVWSCAIAVIAIAVLFYFYYLIEKTPQFIGPPPGQNAGTGASGAGNGSIPPGFHGPSGPPNIKGPSGPPPSY